MARAKKSLDAKLVELTPSIFKALFPKGDTNQKTQWRHTFRLQWENTLLEPYHQPAIQKLVEDLKKHIEGASIMIDDISPFSYAGTIQRQPYRKLLDLYFRFEVYGKKTTIALGMKTQDH